MYIDFRSRLSIIYFDLQKLTFCYIFWLSKVDFCLYIFTFENWHKNSFDDVICLTLFKWSKCILWFKLCLEVWKKFWWWRKKDHSCFIGIPDVVMIPLDNITKFMLIFFIKVYSLEKIYTVFVQFFIFLFINIKYYTFVKIYLIQISSIINIYYT